MHFVIPMQINGQEEKRYFSHIPYRLNDWFTTEDIQSWRPGDNIMIYAGTGTGKSYFVKNNLLADFKRYGLRVLYLVPRTLLKDKFSKEIGVDDTVTLTTYQALEASLKFDRDNLKSWDVIINDEAHYFVADSSFSRQTDISFDWIMEQKNAVKIFLTATPRRIAAYFRECEIPFTEYVVPLDNLNIKSLQFFSSEAQFDVLADQIISENKKGVFFIWSAQKAYDLHCKYKNNSLFLCSESNSTFSKYMDKEAIAAMIEAEHFDCNLLFATAAFDTGVTLKDSELSTIIIDMVDPDSVIQCLGRKRPLGEDDTLDLYIRNYNNNRIVGLQRKMYQQADESKQFVEGGAKNYNAQHNRGNSGSGIVVDKPIEIDGKTYFEKDIVNIKNSFILQMIALYNEIMQHKNGYMGFIAEQLSVEEYNIMEEDQRIQSLAEYLESMVGKPMLTREERKPLIEKMNIRQDGHLQKRFAVLATWLEGSRLPYGLHERPVYVTVDGKRKHYRAWEVVRLVSGNE